MKKLTVKEIQHLKALAHNLSPVVMIGVNGLTETVLKEIHINLQAHELIKIKVLGAHRDFRSTLIKDICFASNATLVQHIGKLIIIYRQAEKPKITF
jgi:RNA-binding protein